MSVFWILSRVFRVVGGRAGLLACGLALLAACASPSGPRGAAVSNLPRAVPEAPYVIIVRAGDSLSVLAERHDVPMRVLAGANDLAPPYAIYAGQRLTVPVPRTHVVRRGDTLSEIALAYGASTGELAALNGRSAPYPIYEGERLRVGGWTPAAGPGDTGRPAPPTRTASARPVPRPEAHDAGVRAEGLALAAPPARSGRFLWPAQGRIISSFGPKKGGLHNDGINIRVPAGAPVVASDHGLVAYAGDGLSGYGNLVLVRHRDGYVTAYAHNSEVLVRRGDVVERGQTIARAGASGSVSEPQVHFEIRRGTKPVDPMTYLGNTMAAR